jgi:hypothetical protein
MFNTALILTLLYVSALLPLSGFSCACDAANAAQNDERISFPSCCCSAGACSEKAPDKSVSPVRPGNSLCANQEMCCCSSADDELFDLQTIAVKQERRSPLKDGRCAIVLPVAFIPPQTALCVQVVHSGECRSPISLHIPTTILLL